MPISGTDPALTEARVGMMRLGGSRLGYVLPIPAVTINGTIRTSDVRIEGCSVRDILNGTPNTATCRADGFTPTEGHEVILAFGTGPTQFRGRILSTNKIYELKPANLAWDCQCISEEWLLNRRKVTKRWLSTSASVIIRETFSAYTSGFSTAGVANDLPVLDEFTVTNEDVTDVLDRVCQRIGEDWQLDYSKVLHVPAADGQAANAITDSNDHGMSGIAVSTDLSQVRTRQSGEGGGSVASTDVAVGQTTIPVDDSSRYATGGGTVKSGPQFITYTGKSTIDGTGSKVGGKAGLAPGAPSAAVVAGTAGKLSVGDYRYAVAHELNGGGTEAGNNSTAVTIAHVTAPSSNPTLTGGTGGSMPTGNTFNYLTTFGTLAGETIPAGQNEITLSGGNTKVSLSSIPTSADGRVTKRRIYRVDYSEGIWRLVTTINDNTTTTFEDTAANASLAVTTVPSVNTSGSGQVDLTNIATGPTGTTARLVFRSPVNIVSTSGYKFLTRISGNVTTTYTDNIADTELGNDLPLTSTVGPLAGDTTIPSQDIAAHASGGGWVIVAGQIVRHTGTSGSTLTGVPASGIGALTASVPYGTPLINAPHLTGVTGILYAINKGDEVNVWVTRNDTAAQTFMTSAVGGDGIHEADPIQDRRMSETEIIARCDAKLEELSTPLVTVRYLTRDITTQSGRDVTITLSAPTSISGTFRIQSVTTTGFVATAVAARHSASADYRPLRQVECSSRRLSFEQILRVIKAA